MFYKYMFIIAAGSRNFGIIFSFLKITINSEIRYLQIKQTVN